MSNYYNNNNNNNSNNNKPPTSLSLPQHNVNSISQQQYQQQYPQQSTSTTSSTSNYIIQPSTPITATHYPLQQYTTPQLDNSNNNNQLKRNAIQPPLTTNPSPIKKLKLDELPPLLPNSIQSNNNSSSPLTSLPPSSIPIPQSQSQPQQLNPQIPLPLLLLTYATHLHSLALTLEPKLTETNLSIEIYSSIWSEYQRLEAGAILILRNLIHSGGGTGVGGGRLELRGRIMLVEILMKTQGTGEAEKIVAKGISAAQKHEAFKPYLYQLYSFQILLSIKSNNLKFAKTTLKRILSEVLLPLQFPEWYYHFQLSLFMLCTEEKDYPGALSALREIIRFAESRGDREMKWGSKVLIARLALGEGEMDMAKEIIDEVAEMLGYTASPNANVGDLKKLEEERKRNLSGQLKVLFVLMYCLYNAEMGSMKLAKEKLKIAHSLLDQNASGSGEVEGWVEIPIRPVQISNKPSTPSTTSFPKTIPPLFVKLQLPSKSLVYAFTFLVSVTVQRDPFGTKPRAIIYAAEGLRTINAKLSGTEPLPPPLSPFAVPSTISTLSRIKIHLHIFLAELSIMRSQFNSAQNELSLAISTSRRSRSTRSLLSSYFSSSSCSSNSNNHQSIGERKGEGEELWNLFSPRIILAKGLLYQARGKELAALECFDTVVQIVQERINPASQTLLKLTPGIGAGGVGGVGKVEKGLEELAILAKSSILLIKLGQGFKIRLGSGGLSSSSIGNNVGPSNSLSSGVGGDIINRRKSSTTPSTLEELYLNDLAFEIVQFTSSSSSSSSPPTSFSSTSTPSKLSSPYSTRPKTQTTSMKLLNELIQSLTKGEIIKSKIHLSKTLTLINDSSGGTGSAINHLKALVLALLANLFLLTADSEAQKMLVASMRIARGMGSKISEEKSRPPPPPPPLPAASSATTNGGNHQVVPVTAPPTRVAGPESVGNARLGFWLGERLLLSYQKDLENTSRKDDPSGYSNKFQLVKEQIELNNAHKFVMKRDGLE